MTSDNVLSICFCDIDEDEEYELIVGCEDSTIGVFKGEELLYEIDASAAVTSLCSFGICFFGFALRNGSYGVYEGRTLLWKEKDKEGIVGMSTIYGEKRNGVVIGFRNGKVEVRDNLTGQKYYQCQMDGQISSLLRSKFVGYDVDQVLVVLRNGEVYGYDISWDLGGDVIISDPRVNKVNKVNQLREKKNILTSKLQNIKDFEAGGVTKTKQLIPKDTSLTIGFKFNFKKKCPELVVNTQSTAVVRGVVVYGEKIFENDVIS